MSKLNWNHTISKVPRVRFAPSPTGYLHVGGARTALYCSLFAKAYGGEFILRVEDTDEARSTTESLQMQLSDLHWLGLQYSEGVDSGNLKDFGPFGPYRQSARLSIYREYAERLLQSGKAYYCFLTDAEIEAQRGAAGDGQFQVKSPYRDWPLQKSLAQIQSGQSAVVRFKTALAAKEYVVSDLVRGEVRFPSDMVGDFVLLRSGGMPVYNFCCVIDDALMKITHVLRAEEHLPNTLRQLMLYEAFDFPVPEFGHLSIILGGDRQKLSKRHGATSVHEYKERGFLPEAIKNFIALLGWSPTSGDEVLSDGQMAAQFDVTRLHPAAAVFDEVKLKWMNAQHLRALPHDELWSRLLPFLQAAGLEFTPNPAWQDRVLSVFKIRMETLVDGVELLRPLAPSSYKVQEASTEVLSWPQSGAVITAWSECVAGQEKDFMEEAEFLALQDQVKEKVGVAGKHLFMPIRVAVIGQPQGADLKALVPLLSKTELLRRAQVALSGKS
jgi:nondiscriminating glutamyl-tRNA synthetase